MLVAFAIREGKNWGRAAASRLNLGPLFSLLGCDGPATLTPLWSLRTHQTRSGPRCLLIRYPFLSSEFIFQMELMIWLVSVSLRSLKSPLC